MSETCKSVKQGVIEAAKGESNNPKRQHLTDAEEPSTTECAATTAFEARACGVHSGGIGNKDGDAGDTSANNTSRSRRHSGKQKADTFVDRVRSITKAIFGLNELRGACTTSFQELMRSTDEEMVNDFQEDHPRTIVEDSESDEGFNGPDLEAWLHEANNTVHSIDN